MSQFSKKLTIYCLIIAMLSLSFSGCKNKDENAENGAENAGEVQPGDALDDAVADVLGNGQEPSVNQGDNAQPAADTAGTQDAQTQQPIAEESPVAITRIEMDPPLQSTASELPDEDEDKTPAPNLFPITECQFEVNGRYLVKLSKDILKEVNKRRADYGISSLKQNTSLLACADSRCKEQAYFTGHFRPDGSAFTSVSPDGYVKGECIAVGCNLTVNDIMEDWFSVNKSRMQIMHPDYTQCGISGYEINGVYYIAAEFSY